MSRRSTTSLAAALSTLAVLVPVTSTATSEAQPSPARERYSRVTATDQTNDVWLWNVVSKKYQHVDGWEVVDVTRVVGTHYRNSVVVVMKLLDLSETDYQHFGVMLVTPELTRQAWVDVEPEDPGGKHVLIDEKGDRVSAKGITHKVDHARSTVRIEIPRARLGDPRWVQLAFWNRLWTYYENGEFGDHPADDRAMTPRRWREDPPLTARLWPAAVAG